MIYYILANVILLFHLLFIAFAVAGVALVYLRPKWMWIHIPAVIWAAGIEFTGGLCPLTPLENDLRELAGQQGYSGSFVEHYLLPVIYPDQLTRELQIVLGMSVMIVNLTGYFFVWRKRKSKRGEI